MKAISKSALLRAILCAIVALSTTLAKSQDDTSIVRSFEQIFQIDSEALLDLNIRYSFIQLANWDSSAVRIQGQVEALTLDSAKAEQIFNRITVEMYGNALEVGLSTSVDAEYEERSEQPFRINFKIMVPNSIGVLGRFDFCEVQTPTLFGPTDLKYNYSTLEADSLNFDKTEVAGRYSKTEINAFSGNLLVNQYGDLNVGAISDSTEVINEYGKTKIKSLKRSCRSLSLANDFGEIELVLAKDTSYELSVDSSYGSLIFTENDTELPETDPSTETSWKATIGDSETSSKLSIDNEFGTITFSR